MAAIALSLLCSTKVGFAREFECSGCWGHLPAKCGDLRQARGCDRDKCQPPRLTPGGGAAGNRDSRGNRGGTDNANSPRKRVSKASILRTGNQWLKILLSGSFSLGKTSSF